MQSENSLRWRLFWWAVFAAAFGVTEAAVVVYVRQLLGYPVGVDYAEIWEARKQTLSVFAMGNELRARGLFGVELAREAGTIVLLFGAAMAAGKSARERFGVFCYTFALWDLTYYAYLLAFIGFPRSLAATDIYFLIPITWYGPVWFPVCVVMPALLWLGVICLRPAKASVPTPVDPERVDPAVPARRG